MNDCRWFSGPLENGPAMLALNSAFRVESHQAEANYVISGSRGYGDSTITKAPSTSILNQNPSLLTCLFDSHPQWVNHPTRVASHAAGHSTNKNGAIILATSNSSYGAFKRGVWSIGSDVILKDRPDEGPKAKIKSNH